MPLEEPSWWYTAAGSDWRHRALTPLAAVYGWTVIRRFATTEPYRSPIPVVCVGNFTAGGTGKTPLSLRLADMVVHAGGRPAFLSRGYGGSSPGPLLVDPAVHTADVVGDEPLLLATTAATIISRNRAAGARALERTSPRPTVIIMDDGLQNPQLAKTLVVAVVDGHRGLGNGGVIPAGPLRAPLAFQFDKTDAIVVNLGASPETREPAASSILASLRAQFSGPVLTAWAEPIIGRETLAGRRVVAYAGIGNPQRFFTLLEQNGVRLADTVAFKDHHRYQPADAERLLALAASCDAVLMTTAKDHARLLGQTAELAKLRAESAVLPIRLVLPPRDEARLAALLQPLIAP
ncbi:MAG: tetraacyldisaccharide 4'-kinase [Hyphomicrobiaceae bacterium]|nr:tetraacyldisaccharide 4'-kinase [Hyphomicrobiaceae bacterium]